MGFQFKIKLSAIMAVINGAAAGLSYIASQGNITATIVCTAIIRINSGNLILQRLACNHF